jgi:class 3 adenylate cyclase/tetratricopeptide (TPR) repeat protein
LFADVKGSMELAEQLDPERWSAIMQRFFEILTEGIERFEGFVDKFTGDGIMALFGAPIAHEDHAHRACYSALYLQERLKDYADTLRVDPGVSFSYRIGLNSGEVVVGTIAKSSDALRMDYTAQGHTVGLGQRMEQLAPADGIALSEHTHNLVEGFFDTRALGPTHIKGARDTVGVHVLEGAGRFRTRLDTSRARGLSRFVGRDAEVAALEAALQQSLAGEGRVAAVVGEAGVGKSRLCAEFVERCKAEGLAVFEAHCPAHGKTVPYLPLLELLRNLFGITEQDTPADARQRIAGTLALLDDAFADDRAMVLDFLGVADPNAPPIQLEPAVRQRRLFAFIRRLIQLRTEQEPIVLLIDDLHWIDPGSDSFVAQIVEAVSTTKTLLLVNFRPEYSADWLRKSWILQLPMAPLGAEALAELVRDWVGDGPTVADLPERIGERSGGNPFFTEEIVLSLIETGRLVGTRGAFELTGDLDEREVPATVQALLAARIDRLGEREKQLIYSAAVIGKEFTRSLLEAVAELDASEFESALASLSAAEMVYERAMYPVAEYAFKHPLTHEVALGAQLTNARRRRHASAACAIAESDPERLDENAALLARHWDEAGDPTRAAEWHIRAARWVRANDLAASGEHWSQALESLAALPDSNERNASLLEIYPQLLDTFDRLGVEPERSVATYSDAIELARRVGDRRKEALIEAVYAYLLSGHGDIEGMRSHGERAAELADAEGDVAVQIFARFPLGRAEGWLGRLLEALRVFGEAEAIGKDDSAAEIEVLGWRPYVECIAVGLTSAAFRGRVADAWAPAERVSEFIKRSGHQADLSSPASDRVWVCWVAGDSDRALRYTAEALQLAERFGADRNVVYALLARGVAFTIAERWEEAADYFERALSRISETGAANEWERVIEILYPVCLAYLGEHDRALRMASEAAKRARAEGLHLMLAYGGPLRARALRVCGLPGAEDAIEAQCADTYAQYTERGEWNGFLPHILIERAALARVRGDQAGTERDLTEARRLFAEMGVTGWDDYVRSIEE